LSRKKLIRPEPCATKESGESGIQSINYLTIYLLNYIVWTFKLKVRRTASLTRSSQSSALSPEVLDPEPYTVFNYFNLFVCACRGIAESDAGSVCVCG